MLLRVQKISDKQIGYIKCIKYFPLKKVLRLKKLCMQDKRYIMKKQQSKCNILIALCFHRLVGNISQSQ